MFLRVNALLAALALASLNGAFNAYGMGDPYYGGGWQHPDQSLQNTYGQRYFQQGQNVSPYPGLQPPAPHWGPPPTGSQNYPPYQGSTTPSQWNQQAMPPQTGQLQYQGQNTYGQGYGQGSPYFSQQTPATPWEPQTNNQNYPTYQSPSAPTQWNQQPMPPQTGQQDLAPAPLDHAPARFYAALSSELQIRQNRILLFRI